MRIAKPISAAAAALSACLCACFSVYLSGCESQGTGSTTESGVVSGRLLAEGNIPITGAAVALVPADHVPSPVLRKTAAAGEAVTDAEGRYRISGVAAGTYSLIASKDTLAGFRDSVMVTGDGLEAGTDTLRPAGSLEGKVVLQAGDDPRTVLILVLGTNVLTVPRDSSGGFSLSGMGAGEYRVRFLSTIKDYRPLDTLLTIRAGGADSLAEPLRLPFKGIAAVSGLTAAWNAAALTVDLAWQPADPALVSGYNIYRAAPGAPFGSVPFNAAPIVKASYRDTAVEMGKTYAYAVKALDGNGNPGAVFSAPVSALAAPEYALARSFQPAGYTGDVSPLAVSGAEIFWLRPTGVDVYDTAGALLRSFGAEGPDPLIHATAIRVFGDTVYVHDVKGETVTQGKSEGVHIRKFTKAGKPAGAVDLSDLYSKGVAGSAADLRVEGDGTLFTTNGFMIYALRPNGALDSAALPLDAEFANIFAKLESVGGNLLVMGSYRIWPGDIRKTQSALMSPGLVPGPRLGADYFLNAYAGDAEGNTWIIRDDSLIQEWDKDGAVKRKIRLPESLYRDIQFESGVIYLFDYTAGAILIYRRT